METLRGVEVMDRIAAGTMPELRRVDLANGKQARVVRIADYPGAERACVAKFCGGEHHGYTQAEALGLIDATVAYRADLQRAGIMIPINHRIQQTLAPDGSTQIVMVDELHGDGEDLKAKLLNGYASDHKRWIMFKILEFLDKLPDGRKQNPLITCPTEVLGDFKPDNWVLEGNDTILIDYFGPKRWGEDGLTTPYNPKMDALLTREAITFLCGDRRGQFCRIIAMAKRTFPDTYEFTRDLALTLLKHNHPEAHDWVADEVKRIETGDGATSIIHGMYQVHPNMLERLKGSDAV